MRTNIAPRSQRLVLINQRGRHILSLIRCSQYVFPCVLFLRVVCGCWPMLSRCRPTLADTLPLSLCLSATLPCSLPFKRCCDTVLMINRNTDFSQHSSYHFKGSTNTKLVSPVGMKKSLLRLWEKKRKSKNVSQKFLSKLWRFLL